MLLGECHMLPSWLVVSNGEYCELPHQFFPLLCGAVVIIIKSLHFSIVGGLMWLGHHKEAEHYTLVGSSY